MPHQEETVITNTVPSPTDSTKEYETLVESGKMGRFVCGFIRIQNIKKKNHFTGTDDDCYRLTFRAKDRPNAYVNHDIKASCKSNSHMFATVRNMTNGKLTTKPNSQYADRDEVFDLMIAALDTWFEVKVEGRPWKDSVWVNVVQDQIEPCQNPPDKPPSEFFEQVVSSDATQTPTYGGKETVPEPKKVPGDVAFEDDDIPF
jgi:hypothetical protein